MTLQDGGPAFPGHHDKGGPYPEIEYEKGMTLRDYFAAKAMQGFCADPSNHALFDDMNDMARSAYEAADAMLAARAIEQATTASERG